MTAGVGGLGERVILEHQMGIDTGPWGDDDFEISPKMTIDLSAVIQWR